MANPLKKVKKAVKKIKKANPLKRVKKEIKKVDPFQKLVEAIKGKK